MILLFPVTQIKIKKIKKVKLKKKEDKNWRGEERMKARWVQSRSVYLCLVCFVFRYGGRCSEQLPSVVWDPWNPLYVVLILSCFCYQLLCIYPVSYTVYTMRFFQRCSDKWVLPILPENFLIFLFESVVIALIENVSKMNFFSDFFFLKTRRIVFPKPTAVGILKGSFSDSI